jgi:transposase
MKAAGLQVELLETRHVRAAFKSMPVKTDRKDARGIAQLMLAWLVPARALQIRSSAGRARPFDGAQAGSIEALRCGNEPAGLRIGSGRSRRGVFPGASESLSVAMRP